MGTTVRACGSCVRGGAGRVQGGGRRGLAPPGPRRPAAPAPAWAPPRGSCAHRAALAPKCVTGTGRAPQAARARLASGQCGPDQGSRAVSGAGAASRKALGLRGPPRAGGAHSAAGGTPGTGLRGRGAREGYTFSSPPRLASSRAAAAEVSSRGNYADPSRGSSPRPFSAPSPWLGSRCWPARGRRLWQPEPGGGGGRRSPTGHSLALPCDAVLRPATPRAPRARAPPRRAPCSCRDPRARRPRPSPRSISASAGR